MLNSALLTPPVSSSLSPAAQQKQKWLYIDAQAGMSGNMFLAALVDLLHENQQEEVVQQWQAAIIRLNLPDVHLVHERVSKCGLGALHVEVLHHEHHCHRGLSDVLSVLKAADLPAKVMARAERIFRALAEAEAKVHQTTVEKIHFHEVGAVDAIVDVMSAAFLFESLGVNRVFCSALRTGSGFVKCAHGNMPIPAPATARLLLGKPSFAGDVSGEWLTPTGAAILHGLDCEYGPQPMMQTLALGVGAGTKNAPHPNVVRVFLGESLQVQDELPGTKSETLIELLTHVDDMSGEDLGALSRVLLDGPALDVFLAQGVGKKNRPQTEIRVLLKAEHENQVMALLFQHSTTFGVRSSPVKRIYLKREMIAVETSFGEVAVKVHRAEKNSGFARAHVEFDDCFRLAQQAGASVTQVRQAALSAWAQKQKSKASSLASELIGKQAGQIKIRRGKAK